MSKDKDVKKKITSTLTELFSLYLSFFSSLIFNHFLQLVVNFLQPSEIAALLPVQDDCYHTALCMNIAIFVLQGKNRSPTLW